MTTTVPRKVFINLSVQNLEKSKEFFTKLGFSFNLKCGLDKSACMVLSEEGYVMLLGVPFFKTFTKREVCDTSAHTEAIVALSCTSRAEVDEMVNKAIAAGGEHAMEPQDHGFMYGWSFYDLDGHHWEVFWMDPKMAVEHQ